MCGNWIAGFDAGVNNTRVQMEQRTPRVMVRPLSKDSSRRENWLVTFLTVRSADSESGAVAVK